MDDRKSNTLCAADANISNSGAAISCLCTATELPPESSSETRVVAWICIEVDFSREGKLIAASQRFSLA